MKILIDARVILNQQTGIGNYTHNLTKHLFEIDKTNKYTILVHSSLKKNHPIFTLQQKNAVFRIVDIEPVSVQQQYLLRSVLKEAKPDIYHYPNWDIPLFHNVNSIFTIHDLTYLLHDKLYVNLASLKKIYTRINIYLGLKKSRKVIVVSENTKRDLLHNYYVADDKIRVIYEACDEMFIPAAKTDNTHLNLNKLKDEKKYFLFVGEKRPHKNLIRLIKAFKLFNENLTQYKLLIVGKQYAQYDEPEKLVQKLKLSNDVVFLDYVDNDTLIVLYQNAQALVFVSLYEGFGIPVLEAMACGTPVITSNIAATNEIAFDAAIKIDPYHTEKITEAMIDIIKNKKLRNNKIKKGLARAKEFRWEKTAEQTLQLYNEVYKGS